MTEDNDNTGGRVSRRSVLKAGTALGASAVLGGVMFSSTGAAMTSNFSADPVTVSNDEGDLSEVHLNPTSTVRWTGFDEPVTKIRQLIEARLVGEEGDVLTPQTGEGGTQATANGWWPIYRETPWLFDTLTGEDAPQSFPVSNGGVTLDVDGNTVIVTVPEGDLSNDQTPQWANHTEVFIGDPDGAWTQQVRYATGTDANVAYSGWSYQNEGGEWQNGLPPGVSGDVDGDTMTLSYGQGFSGVGAHHTTVDSVEEGGGSDAESNSTPVADGPEGTRAWDSGGLFAVGDADFYYEGEPDEGEPVPATHSLRSDASYFVSGSLGDEKGKATSGEYRYDLVPNTPLRTEGPAIYVVSDEWPMPDYGTEPNVQGLLNGTSIGQAGPFTNGSYGTVAGAQGDFGDVLFDNDMDDTMESVWVELRLTTSLHTDYDFVETVPEGDPMEDAYSPLVMGHAAEPLHQFSNIHAIPYDEMQAHTEHPAIDFVETSFRVDVVNEEATTPSGTPTSTPGTDGNTGGS